MNVIVSLVDYANLVERKNQLTDENNILKSKIKTFEEELIKCKEMEKFLISQMSLLRQEKETECNQFNENPFGSNKKKFFDYKNKEAIDRIKLKIEKIFTEISEMLTFSTGLSILNISLTNEDVKDVQFNYLKKKNDNKIEIMDTNYEKYLGVLIKDLLHISDKNWNFLKLQLGLNIDTESIIRKKRLELNKQFKLNPFNDGYYVEPKEAIIEKLRYLIEQDKVKDEEILIKISADGTIISKKIKIINLVFSIINEKTVATTASGTYLLAIFPYRNESNEEIKKWLTVIWDKLKSLKKITLRSKEFNISYIFCADYKMMLNVLGMKQANSTQPCIWCEATQKNLEKKGIKRNEIITNESLNFIQNDLFDDDAIDDHIYNENEKVTNINRERLLKEIPLENFVVDILHLFLRISERLGHCLLNDFVLADNLVNVNYDPKKHKNISMLIEFLEEKCKIKVLKLKYTNQSIDSIFTKMQGPEKIKMFNYIISNNDFLNLLTHCKIRLADKKVKLWQFFYKIINDIKDNTLDYDFSGACQKWLLEFKTLYGNRKITPYIHIFGFHVPEQILKYGTLAYYECQGLEKFNDLSTRIFFHSTNKHSWVEQMMLKNLRIQKLLSVIKLRTKRTCIRKTATQSKKVKRFCTTNCSTSELEQVIDSQNILFRNWLN